MLHLYIVIFQNQNFKFTAFFVLLLTGGYATTNIVQNLLTCRPVAFNWDKTIPGDTCSLKRSPYLASAIINTSIDTIIVIFPTPMLWSLRMNTKKRIALTIIFGLGALKDYCPRDLYASKTVLTIIPDRICILSAVRIHAIATLDYEDFSYSVVADGIFSILDPCLHVIDACLPILQPVVHKMTNYRVFPAVRKSTGAYSSRRQLAKDSTSRSERHKTKLFRRLDESGVIGNVAENMFPLGEVVSPRLISEKNGRTLSVITSKKISEDKNERIEITTVWSVSSRLDHD